MEEKRTLLIPSGPGYVGRCAPLCGGTCKWPCCPDPRAPIALEGVGGGGPVTGGVSVLEPGPAALVWTAGWWEWEWVKGCGEAVPELGCECEWGKDGRFCLSSKIMTCQGIVVLPAHGLKARETRRISNNRGAEIYYVGRTREKKRAAASKCADNDETYG